VTITRVGTSENYGDGWDKAFSGTKKKKAVKKKTTSKAKKSTKTKKAKKK